MQHIQEYYNRRQKQQTNPVNFDHNSHDIQFSHLEIVSQMVKVNGLFISMKGSKAIEELNEAGLTSNYVYSDHAIFPINAN